MEVLCFRCKLYREDTLNANAAELYLRQRLQMLLVYQVMDRAQVNGALTVSIFASITIIILNAQRAETITTKGYLVQKPDLSIISESKGGHICRMETSMVVAIVTLILLILLIIELKKEGK